MTLEARLDAYEAFLDELPSGFGSGPNAAMVRPHLCRKHIMLRSANFPDEFEVERTSWATIRRLSPDVNQHLEGVEKTWREPRRLAQALSTPTGQLSMWLCLLHEALSVPGAADIMEDFELLRKTLQSYKDTWKSNPSPRVLVRIALGNLSLHELNSSQGEIESDDGTATASRRGKQK